MRALWCLAIVAAACGDDDETCVPDPVELPNEGMFADPYQLELPADCVAGGLRNATGRWFIVDPSQTFQFEYPRFEATCSGIRRSFTPPDDHYVGDGYSFFTWSDGTRYFQRTETRFDDAVYVRAFVTCAMPNDTLAATYARYQTEIGSFVSHATGTRFGRKDELASGLALVGELGLDVNGNVMTPVNLVIDGGYAYVAGWSGLDIIDVADPASPRAIAHHDGSFNDVRVVRGGVNVVAYLAPADSEGQTSIVDVTTPTAPVLVGFLPEYSHSLFVEQRDAATALYLATYNDSVPRYDVTLPLTPVRQGMAIAPGNSSGVHDLFVAGDRIFANNTGAGLVVFDVDSDLRNAVERGRDRFGYSHSSWAGSAGRRPVILHGAEGMTGTQDGAAYLRILDGDATSPSFMSLLGRYQTRPEVGLHNFEMHGDRAYIAYYQDGVRVVDLSDPTEPREVAHYNTWDPDTAYGASFEGALGIRVHNGLIYVADDLRGLLIFRE